jgi:hypothetical protein
MRGAAAPPATGLCRFATARRGSAMPGASYAVKWSFGETVRQSGVTRRSAEQAFESGGYLPVTGNRDQVNSVERA